MKKEKTAYFVMQSYGFRYYRLWERSSRKKVLLCKSDTEKYIFELDDNDITNGIYYENNIDLTNYYTDKELKENKENGSINYIIDDNIFDCTSVSYACNSKYENDMISNKLYVLTKEDAKKVGLEDYFGMNKTDLRIKIVTNESVTCEEIINNQSHVISGQKKKSQELIV